MRTLRFAINVTLDGCCHHEAGIPPDEESMKAEWVTLSALFASKYTSTLEVAAPGIITTLAGTAITTDGSRELSSGNSRPPGNSDAN